MAELFNLNYQTFEAARDLRAIVEEFGIYLKQLETTGEAERAENKVELLNMIQKTYYDLLHENGYEY